MQKNKMELTPKLNELAWRMKLASMDYDDNAGSSKRQEFWQYFETAKENYLAEKERVENDV